MNVKQMNCSYICRLSAYTYSVTNKFLQFICNSDWDYIQIALWDNMFGWIYQDLWTAEIFKWLPKSL